MRRSTLLRITLAAALVLTGAAAAIACSTAPARSASDCDLYADPAGDDAGQGSGERPFRTATRLVASLQPGQAGCLQGSFVENVDVRRGGTPDAPITIRSVPGQRASVRGRFYVADSANDVVVEGLALDGRSSEQLPSPTVNGDRIVFRDNDVTNANTEICFLLGSASGWGIAVDVVIEGNRIHDCGRLPETNHDHGIYVESSRGARIVSNLIYDNADRGIQLYPDAQGTVVSGNVLDGNGEGIIFSGASGKASSGNVVAGNVISNSRTRYNVESWYPEGNPVGSDNVAEQNCLWNGRQGNVAQEVGFVARGNVVADPTFVDRAAKDFRLRADSPCAGLLSGSGHSPVDPARVRERPGVARRAAPASVRPAARGDRIGARLMTAFHKRAALDISAG